LSFVPRVIDLFQEWEHTFLVEERVSGGSLNDYWAGEEVILAPSIRHQDRIERFLPRFKHVAEELIRMVEDVHAHGVLLGDLSAGNVLVEPETLNMWFIDFESAVRVGDDVELMGFSTRWGTPFPGRWLTRVSNDYATGAAGIGLFFERLLRPGPRRFVDLPS
jgi:tRNA A-37 threonylcarbamoyl transferase component Bud32